MSSEIPNEEGAISEGGLLNVGNGDHWDQLVRKGIIKPVPPAVERLLESRGLPLDLQQPIFNPEDIGFGGDTGSGSTGYTGEKPDAKVYTVGGPLSATGIQ